MFVLFPGSGGVTNASPGREAKSLKRQDAHFPSFGRASIKTNKQTIRAYFLESWAELFGRRAEPSQAKLQHFQKRA